MPVNTPHPDYDATLLAWVRARDVLAGEDAVKAGGERYLPKLDSQAADDYQRYKQRALFFNATARTAEGYLGLVFRRAPTVKLPEDGSESAAAGAKSALARAMAEFAKDVDMQGTALAAYAKSVVSEVVGLGRAGTLIDWEPDQGGSRTGHGRAFAVQYRAEQILNWRTDRVYGRNLLTLLTLRENAPDTGQPDADHDDFETDRVEQIRVLKLVPGQSPGDRLWRYEVEIWRPRKEWTWRGTQIKWDLVESRTPLRLGKPLPAIPFVFHGPQHSLPDVSKLPLADIISVNLDHYRLDADYKHGLHYTALPTAYVCGFDKDKDLQIGSSTAWQSDVIGATAGFLEFKGQGLQTFERAMDRDERDMAILGSRMLEGQKRVGETADAIELRQSGENSVLTTLALSVSEGLTRVLRWVYWWNSTEQLPEDIAENRVLIQLNTDFSTKWMSSTEITAIVAAWEAGAISRETMFDLFRRGEVLPPGRSNEEENRLVSQPSTPQPSHASATAPTPEP